MYQTNYWMISLEPDKRNSTPFASPYKQQTTMTKKTTSKREIFVDIYEPDQSSFKHQPAASSKRDKSLRTSSLLS